MTDLYLVRHGETDWNLQRRVQGSTDIPLNATGRVQALATGRLFAMADRQWDAVIASPLSRALETGTIIAREIGLPAPTTVDDIRERAYGEAEGLDHDEIDAQFPYPTPVPGRESRDEVTARVMPALLAIAQEHPGEAVIVVAHGGVIRAVLDAVDPDGSHHGPIRNGSVHSFRHTDGSLELVVFDDPLDERSLDCATDSLEVQNPLESQPS